MGSRRKRVIVLSLAFLLLIPAVHVSYYYFRGSPRYDAFRPCVRNSATADEIRAAATEYGVPIEIETRGNHVDQITVPLDGTKEGERLVFYFWIEGGQWQVASAWVIDRNGETHTLLSMPKR